MSDVTKKVEASLARFDRITRSLDERDGPARAAARREKQRLNADLKGRAARVGVAIGIISLLTIIAGLVLPGGIGIFGFLAAVGLAIGLAALLAFVPDRASSAQAPAADLPNAQMVQRFDSYLYRTRPALPAPAQAELDRISAALPALKQTLERVGDLDPNAQDARRLMSTHLPGLIDRYMHVPAAYRSEQDGDGLTVDQRLVESLTAGGVALKDIGEKLARADLREFETQGRFIKSRYGEDELSE